MSAEQGDVGYDPYGGHRPDCAIYQLVMPPQPCNCGAEQGDVEDDRLFTKWQRDYERQHAAEQGDVELVRHRLALSGTVRERAALDRLAAALERAERERDDDDRPHLLPRRLLWERVRAAERERDEAQTVIENMGFPGLLLCDARDRAEKAELALAENEQAWEDMRAYNIRLEERACEAERALAEMREALRWLRMALGWAVFREDSRVWTSNEMRDIEAKIDAALRPSEDTSDES